MKSVYKFVFPLLFGIFLCFVCITVAHAENSNDVVVCNGFEVGDTAIYYVENILVSGQKEVMDYNLQITDSNKYICMYIATGGTVSGYALEMIGFENGGLHTIYRDDGSVESSSIVNVANVKPHAYSSPYWSAQGILFNTNIPVFEDYATASAYVNNKDDSLLSQAVNYKKAYQNGNWVKPFEDIVINDSDIVVPQLSSLSHNGFTIDNLSDNYFVEIYMTSGLQDVYFYLSGSNSIDNSMYFNNYGLISNNTEEALCQKEYDIAMKFGIDNHSVLTDFGNQFYNTYPKPNSIESFGNYKGKELYPIWGVPFGLDFNSVAFFFTDVTPYLNNLNIDKMPLAYSNYRVRFYYYNDSDGMHYGPWADYVYFSDGRVSNSAIFQSDTGNIITTPIQNGSQDDTGNINVNTGSNIDISDFDNPNELFGYLRSIINNISATSNSFTALFSAFFTVIPSEIQAIMWLSIALMCFGSLILWVWRK